MSDGAPNGYSIIEFDGHKYRLRFFAAGRPADYQIQVYSPEEVSFDAKGIEVYANVFNGSERTRVRMRVDDSDWTTMEQTVTEDPTYMRIFELENTIRETLEKSNQALPKDWLALSKPGRSTHLWKAVLPVNLTAGVHVIKIEAHGQDDEVVTEQRLIRVK
jgi:hypothetical protein